MSRPRMTRIWYTTTYESMPINVIPECVEIIRNAMRDKNIRIVKMAADLNIPVSCLYHFFSGSSHSIRHHYLQRIIRYLELKALIRPLGCDY